MKIFNQGGRLFTAAALGFKLEPGKFTEIPDNKKAIAHAEKLLADYPEELVTAESASKGSKAKDEHIVELKAELAAANAKIAKLSKIVLASGGELPKDETASTPAKAEGDGAPS